MTDRGRPRCNRMWRDNLCSYRNINRELKYKYRVGFHYRSNDLSLHIKPHTNYLIYYISGVNWILYIHPRCTIYTEHSVHRTMYICNMYNVYTLMSVDCNVCEYLLYSSNKECLYCNIYAFLAHFETEYITIYLYIDVELLLNK